MLAEKRPDPLPEYLDSQQDSHQAGQKYLNYITPGRRIDVGVGSRGKKRHNHKAHGHDRDYSLNFNHYYSVPAFTRLPGASGADCKK